VRYCAAATSTSYLRLLVLAAIVGVPVWAESCGFLALVAYSAVLTTTSPA
jgi:hypothetical protein